MHVHAELRGTGGDPMPPVLREAAARYFRSPFEGDALPTVDDVARYYRERNIVAVCFTVDWELRSGRPPIPNEEIAAAAREHPDVLIPFASVDPARPDARRARPPADRRARRARASSSIRTCRRSSRTTVPPIRSTR